MRTAIAVAALAAGAIAVPYNKRGVVTNYDVVYVTDVVTITAGQPEPYPTPSSDDKQPAHYGHHHNPPVAYTPIIQQAQPTTTSSTYYEAPASTYQAPAYTPETSTSQPAAKPYTAPSSSSAAPAASVPTSYSEKVVYHHNLHRANHSCSDVEWSDDLYSSAKEIAESCVYAHNTEVQGGGYGQNIAAGVEPANISAIITDLFYNGEEPYFSGLYGQDNPDMSMFEKWGHFSQIVWKGTTHVACATVHCPSGLANVGTGVSPYFTVCNYKSPGNYAGEYGSNVLKPIGNPSAQWNTGLQ